MRRIAQAVAGGRDRRDGTRPVAGRLPELGLVHQALAAVRDQIRLRSAPLVECCSPLRRPGQIEELQALEDHGAVHNPRHDRPHLARADREHHFVQPGQPARLVSHGQQRLTVRERRQGRQVGVMEARGDVPGMHGQVSCAISVVGVESSQDDRDQQVAARRAVDIATEHGLAPAQPTPGVRHLSPHHRAEGSPERALRRLRPFPGVGVPPVGVLPRGNRFAVLTDQVGGYCAPVEVGMGELCQRDLGQEAVGAGPGALGERVSGRCSGHAAQRCTSKS